MKNKTRPDFSAMAEKWPSSHVSRDKIGEFSGGVITPGYLANLDSSKKGPPEKVRCGRKIVYPVASFVRWLEARSENA